MYFLQNKKIEENVALLPLTNSMSAGNFTISCGG
jgi:hypothetical protein